MESYQDEFKLLCGRIEIICLKISHPLNWKLQIQGVDIVNAISRRNEFSHARAVMHVGITNPGWQGKRSRAFPAHAQPVILRIWQRPTNTSIFATNWHESFRAIWNKLFWYKSLESLRIGSLLWHHHTTHTHTPHTHTHTHPSQILNEILFRDITCCICLAIITFSYNRYFPSPAKICTYIIHLAICRRLALAITMTHVKVIS